MKMEGVRLQFSVRGSGLLRERCEQRQPGVQIPGVGASQQREQLRQEVAQHGGKQLRSVWLQWSEQGRNQEQTRFQSSWAARLGRALPRTREAQRLFTDALLSAWLADATSCNQLQEVPPCLWLCSIPPQTAKRRRTAFKLPASHTANGYGFLEDPENSKGIPSHTRQWNFVWLHSLYKMVHFCQ